MYDKVAESLKPSTGENLLKYGIPGIAALYGLGAFDAPDYEGPTERDRERAHARYARNPYLFQKGREMKPRNNLHPVRKGMKRDFYFHKKPWTPTVL